MSGIQKLLLKFPCRVTFQEEEAFISSIAVKDKNKAKKPTVTTPYGCKSPTMPSVKSINTNSTAAYQQNS